MRYRSEEDKCYGVAGMAIGLSVFDAEDLLSEVNIDADGVDCVQFVPDFYYTGSPRVPAHRRGQLRLRTCTVDPGRGPAKLQAAE